MTPPGRAPAADAPSEAVGADKAADRDPMARVPAPPAPPAGIGVPVDRSIRMEQHPTVRKVRAEGRDRGYSTETLDSDWLRALCLEAGADDVGFAALTAPGLEEERDYVLEALPGTRSLISFVVRESRDNVRSRATSLGNADATVTHQLLHEAGRKICRALQDRGFRAAYPSYAFPTEVQRFGTRMWSVSHKRVAVAAGLGHRGIHRNVIHPKFGSFVVLGTVLTQAEISEYSRPLEWNPCLGCNLCVGSCPTGALDTDGSFDFAACYTHNFRDFLTNFGDWVDELADSKDAADYRTRVSQSETVQLWQSLAFKPQYRSSYCISVCPAGEDVVGPFLNDDEEHVRDVVKPLQEKPEPVYVLPGSNAELHVR